MDKSSHCALVCEHNSIRRPLLLHQIPFKIVFYTLQMDILSPMVDTMLFAISKSISSNIIQIRTPAFFIFNAKNYIQILRDINVTQSRHKRLLFVRRVVLHRMTTQKGNSFLCSAFLRYRLGPTQHKCVRIRTQSEGHCALKWGSM